MARSWRVAAASQDMLSKLVVLCIGAMKVFTAVDLNLDEVMKALIVILRLSYYLRTPMYLRTKHLCRNESKLTCLRGSLSAEELLESL
jgi:hypothetical protein